MKRIIRFAAAGALLVFSLAFAILFTWPSYVKFAQLQENIEAKRERIERGEIMLVRLGELDRQVAAHREAFARAEAAVPEDPALPAVYDQIHQLGAASGVLVSSIEANAPAALAEDDAIRGIVQRIAFHVKLTGSYEAIKTFLAGAERLSRVLNARSLDLAASQEEFGLAASVELTAYAKP